MADYVNVPTLEIDFLKPRKLTYDIVGSGMDGARNGVGQSISMDTSGGGVITCTVENCFLHYPEEHEYINWLGAELNGSFRFVNVPIWTDWIGPFPLVNGVQTAIINGITHSDGALFSDGSGYSQATVTAVVTEDAALYDSTIKMTLSGATRALWKSGWFSISHPTKGNRAYRYRKVVSGTLEDPLYTLVFTPPLREAVTAGTTVEWARPKCVMKFPIGFTLPWEIEGFQETNPSMKFIEAN